MTHDQARATVRAYEAHSWAFEVADDGTIFVGGQDHGESHRQARAAGYNGPIVRVYS